MGFSLSSWFFRKRVQAEMRVSGRAVHVHRVTNPYHAVSILAGPACHRTAERYIGQRFLSTEAPPLPLPSCDANACLCRYAHHADRRMVADRRNRDVWNRNPAVFRQDRRESGGRRVTDP